MLNCIYKEAVRIDKEVAIKILNPLIEGNDLLTEDELGIDRELYFETLDELIKDKAIDNVKLSINGSGLNQSKYHGIIKVRKCIITSRGIDLVKYINKSNI